ncbi:hypothetical protein Patl1_17267 [Pistacia atlantica]|uniref:Uncharacterized protein n=1 Tax=Pistacia atlantica TaxID=434234 RepID=A0ACC1B8X9_9ROSI|nr:hypothetical protein Patl1_17267 [Pistacia atlantica]
MEIRHLVSCLLALDLLLSTTESSNPFHYSTKLNRSSFPAGFLFGAGSSAYQYEGAAYADGRKRSIWDTFVIEHPEKIADHSTGDVADEFYYLCKEDVARMKEIGLDSFKFSISWPRVIPQGKLSRGVNWEGVKFYNDLINELLSNGIEPFLTLFHWDLPQALEDEYGGFLSPQIVIVHPVTFGDYPKTMRDLVGNRLPNFTAEQSVLVKGSLDFLGVNYYTAWYAEDSNTSSILLLSYTTDSHVNETVEKNGIPIGELTGATWLYMYPKGLREIAMYIKKKYNLPMYITENGVADANNSSLPVDEALRDSMRITYHQLHLSYLLQAIKKGADVRGYSAWSLLDDFEWKSGYTVRFGFIYVDFSKELRRYLKDSAFWYKNILLKENTAINCSSLLFSA